MIGIGPYLRPRAIVGGFDPDAQAFLSAAGITGATETAAVNTLVTSLKGYGIWTKMKALYPFVTDNRNLLSYTEDFGNGYWGKNAGASVTTNSTTAPDGTTTADTLNLPNGASVAANLTNSTNQTATISFYLRADSNVTIKIGLFSPSLLTSVNLTTSWQRFTYTHTWSGTLYPQVYNDSGASVTVYAWGAMANQGSTATTYQPILTTQQSYISNQFKYNLVNPVDSDAAFRLVFNGGWTFSNQGALPNGTNGYADTKLVPSSVLSLNSASHSVYSRSLSPTGIMGGVNDAVSYLILNNPTSTTITSQINSIGADFITGTVTNSQGLLMANRTDSTTINAWRNSTKVATDSKMTTFRPTIAYYIGSRNNVGSASGYDAKQYGFYHIGDGLTDTEASNLYTAVQAFQTSLNRAIAP